MEEAKKREIETLAEEIGADYVFEHAVDPFAIAEDYGIDVIFEDYKTAFKGLVWYYHENFNIHLNSSIIETATCCDARSTCAHELGHYFLPEHFKRLISGNSISFRGSSFGIIETALEAEADYFGVSLLMPQNMFVSTVSYFPEGFESVFGSKELFKTSLTSTAIRYTTLNKFPYLLIRSEKGNKIKKWVSPSFSEQIAIEPIISINPKRKPVGIELKNHHGTGIRYWGGYSLLKYWVLNAHPQFMNRMVYEENLRTPSFNLILIKLLS